MAVLPVVRPLIVESHRPSKEISDLRIVFSSKNTLSIFTRPIFSSSSPLRSRVLLTLINALPLVISRIEESWQGNANKLTAYRWITHRGKRKWSANENEIFEIRRFEIFRVNDLLSPLGKFVSHRFPRFYFKLLSRAYSFFPLPFLSF